jgi:hypothetical protein
MFGFEKLDVWQKSVEYADLIYRITQGFPPEERFGLTEFAYGSLMESVSELQIAKRQRFLSDEAFGDTYNSAETLARMLSGLHRTFKKRS